MKTTDIIRCLRDKANLSLFEKILAVTNGSVTQLLEVYLNDDVELRTISQEVKEAGLEMAEKLCVDPSDHVNFREVEILGGGRVLIRAKSYAPLKRLERGFKDDLMKADVPIGKLFVKHNIEARRDIISVETDGKRVKRVYNIVRGGKIMMRIEEEFEVGTFK